MAETQGQRFTYRDKSLSEIIERKRTDKDRSLTVHYLTNGQIVLESTSRYSDCNGQGRFNLFGQDKTWIRNFDRFRYRDVRRTVQIKDLDSVKVRFPG